MASFEELSVTIRSRNNRDLSETHGKITKAIYTKQDRLKNASKLFGALLAGAFCAIFIPLVHYLLVPALFIASFIFGFEKFQELERNLGGEGQCTKCKQTLKIVPSKMKNRLTDTCGHCFEELEINLDTLDQ